MLLPQDRDYGAPRGQRERGGESGGGARLREVAVCPLPRGALRRRLPALLEVQIRRRRHARQGVGVGLVQASQHGAIRELNDLPAVTGWSIWLDSLTLI